MPLSSSSVRELVVERGRKEGRKGSAVTDSRKCAGVLMPRISFVFGNTPESKSK